MYQVGSFFGKNTSSAPVSALTQAPAELWTLILIWLINDGTSLYALSRVDRALYQLSHSPFILKMYLRKQLPSNIVFREHYLKKSLKRTQNNESSATNNNVTIEKQMEKFQKDDPDFLAFLLWTHKGQRNSHDN